MLPSPVTIDLFDIEYKPSRAAIDHIADIIEGYGFSVYRIDNFDIRIWFKFTLDGTNLDGSLVVDRMQQSYEIIASTDNNYKYAPLDSKNFQIIEEYLQLLKSHEQRNNKMY